MLDENKKNEENIFAKLRWGVDNLSGQQQKICQYLLDNYSSAVFLTIEDMAQVSKTSPATITRVVKSLGYNCYKEMMSCIEDIIVNNNRSAWLSLEQSIETPKNEKTIMWVSEENCRVIQNSITMPFLEKFDQAVNTLDKARRIFLVGIRSARAATVFFRSMLSQLLPDISILEYGIDEAFETILDMSANDVVVVITLRSGPNCFAVTPLNILRFASRRGLKTILVTNDLSCPGVSYADLSICVGQADGHYTLTPVLTLLEAIVIDLGRLKKDIARKKLKDLENVFEEQNIVLPNSELS